jgi:hypothetical protein
MYIATNPSQFIGTPILHWINTREGGIAIQETPSRTVFLES